MAINIDTLVHNEFGRSAIDQLEKLTGKPTDQVRSGVDRAITEVLDGFSMKARDEAGRQSLYEAARYSDDGLIDEPALFFGGKDERTALADSNTALGKLLGDEKCAGIQAAIQNAAGLAADEASMVTGYVAPGVLGVMKRQMLNGAVLDNSDGIGQMLLGEVTTASVGGAAASIDHSVPKTAPRQTQSQASHSAGGVASGSSGASAAAATVHEDNESDMSWLFRWAMPFVLLGGLVLAGVQNCGPQVAGVAEAETAVMKLAEVETEVDGLNGQITALTAERDEALSDREVAVAEIDRLQSELGTATAAAADTSELDTANAEIADLKDQLAQASDTSELDAANAEIADLKNQLAQAADTSELDAANAEIADLKGQLAQASDTSAFDAEIASLKSQLTQSSDNSALNAEILSLKDQLASVPAPVDNSAEIAELEEQVASLTVDKSSADARTSELKEKLLNVAGAKNRMEAQMASLTNGQSDSQTEVASLTSELDLVRTKRDELATTVAELTTERDQLTAQVAELETERDAAAGKIEIMQSNLDRAIDDATAKRKELVASTSQLAALQESERSKRMALNTRLNNAIAFSKSRGEQLSALQGQAGSEQEKRAALSKRLNNAIAFSKSRGEQVAALQQQVDSEQAKRAELSKQLSNAIAFSKSRGEQLAASEDLAASEQQKRMALSARLNNAIAFSKTRAQKLSEAETTIANLAKSRDGAVKSILSSQRQLEAEREKQKVLSNRLRNAIAFSKQRSQELDADLAKVTKGRTAAIKTVTDLAGKLRASESAGGALEMQVASLQEQVESERQKRMTLTSRLNNAIAFSKNRADQIAALQQQSESAGNRSADLAKRLRNAIAFSKSRAEQVDAYEAQLAATDTEMQAEKDRVASVSASLASDLAAAGVGNVEVRPVEDNQAVGITLGSSDLYRVGSASLSPQGIGLLQTVGSVVSNYNDWRIDVEGHTDAQPIGRVLRQQYPSNWELSTARAAAAVRYLQTDIGIPSDKLSVRGFGEHKPVATNETPDGREANRRIELILRQN